MGVVVPFPSRDQSVVTPPPVTETPEDRRRSAEAHTRTVCTRLLQYYQGLGTWSPACESHMVTAVRALMTICHHLTPLPAVPRGDDDQKV